MMPAVSLEPEIRDLLARAKFPAGVVVGTGTLDDPQAFADSTGVAVLVSGALSDKHYFVTHRDQAEWQSVQRYEPRNDESPRPMAEG